MASAESSSCDICMHAFNEAERKAVTLPCGHDFCLTCLIRLKTAGSQNCPKCRGNWSDVDVEALPGMALIAEAAKAENGDWKKKISSENDQCSNHQFQFDFWSNKEREFYCKKCIIELGPVHSELQLIDDAVPLIKSDIGEKSAEANEQLVEDVKTLDDLCTRFRENLQHVREFMKRFSEIEQRLQDCITIVETLRSETIKATALAMKIDGEKENIKSGADLPIIVSSRTTLESLTQPCLLPALPEPDSLLCNIACTYMESTTVEELPTASAFVGKLIDTTETSAALFLKASTAAVDLKKEDDWIVDSKNYMAAVLTLTLTECQPDSITLTVRPDDTDSMPALVAAVSKADWECYVGLKYYPSFFEPLQHDADQAIFDKFLDNSDLDIYVFFGHLDAARIAKLPNTITELGLAIGSAADAAAVSGLKPWADLLEFHVSVSCDVAPSDVRQLPRTKHLCLHFPGLTDERVDSVRAVIDALMPDRKFQELVFNHSQLTVAGARRLAQQLKGARMSCITIDARGPWRPKSAEKKRCIKELKSISGCNSIYWDVCELSYW